MGDVLVNAANPGASAFIEDRCREQAPNAALYLFWIGAIVLSSLLAFLLGAPLRACAVFAVLGLAPGLIGLVLLPRWGEKTAKTLTIAVWIAAVTAGCAASGGAASAAALGYVAPVELARRYGGRAFFIETITFCGLGLILAAVVAFFAPPPEPVAVLALLGGVSALGFSVLFSRVFPVRAAPRQEADARGMAMFAHELRTPLNHIIGFADLMAQRVFGPLPEAYKDYPDLIAAAGRHQSDLVNTLIDFGRLGSGHYPYAPERVDPRLSVMEVAKGAQSGAEKNGVLVTYDCEGAPDGADLDPRAWRQILYNLVGNAVKFTPAGGKLHVRLASQEGDLRLTVADTGPGLTDAEKAKVGALFARSGEAISVEGAGIGLALTIGLVRLHQGQVQLADAPGGGLLVIVQIPRYTQG